MLPELANNGSQTGPDRCLPSSRQTWVEKQSSPSEPTLDLGFEAAKHFAKVNPAQLVLTAKNEAKGKEAVARMFLRSQRDWIHKSGIWIIDVANFSRVIAFVDRAESEFDRLDILVENAGMATLEYDELEDWERTHRLFGHN
ncbi:uncharacterized protein EV420DRAFT_1480077 [Desarmillaria tabescens]|uniref:Uncharacterized protein n=1 Tax=Armillaria tabescens TaxID=1929756 RepID=A0AA39KED1_ARMTA|nr:uncharacterized protein EV420DRAFT_1480077 [Desarmillaria tabescens]KAK0458351.1 hypothetical protein EV420DRAFT_1480077 [Desarmillaria tabescens]